MFDCFRFQYVPNIIVDHLGPVTKNYFVRVVILMM